MTSTAFWKYPPLTSWLEKRNQFWFSLYTACAAFFLYTCIYALRKTFAVATFEGLTYGALSYKSWLIIAQVTGYALSKFIGISAMAELKPQDRAPGIFALALIAGLSWLGFALLPTPYNMAFLFSNGLSLGLIWGMIFAYLEGRKTTEALGAGLSVSFIFSSGLVKSVGALIMRDWGVSDWWMPFVTSLLFAIPLVACLWLLDHVPPPTAEDELMRTKRKPMTKWERNKFVKTFFPGIVLFVLAYMILTALRDFRDNFAADIWKLVGYENSPGIFTVTEIPVSIAVLLIMGSIMLIKSNSRALVINHVIILIGMIILGASTLLFELHLLTAPIWMMLIGLGLYMGYVPFNSIFFDRLLATFHCSGTVGFIMYLADAFGYMGSIGVLLFKEFGFTKISWLVFFIQGSYGTAILCSILILSSMIYFINKEKISSHPN